MLVLSLSLKALQPCFDALSLPLLGSQFDEQLLTLFLRGPQGLFSLETEMNLFLDIISGLLNPFLDHIDLLGDLHKNNIVIPRELKRDKKGKKHSNTEKTNARQYTYQGKVPFQGQKQVLLLHLPGNIHILRKDEELL